MVRCSAMTIATTSVVLQRFTRVLKHRLSSLLLAVYTFLCIGFVMEMFHPSSNYSEIYRMLQTFAGAVFIASVCRDRSALRWAMYGYLVIGAFTSIALLRSSYGNLSGATAFD